MPTVPPGSKVLLTGATGYIGSWILKRLLEQGFLVRAAVRSLDKARPLQDFFASPYLAGQLEFVVVDDFARDGAFGEAVRGVLAGVLGVLTRATLPTETRTGNGGSPGSIGCR